MTLNMQQYIRDFARFPEENHQERTNALDRAKLFLASSPEEFTVLLEGLAEFPAELFQRSGELWQVWLDQLVQGRKKFSGDRDSAWLESEVPARIATLFAHLPRNQAGRYRLLECLAWGRTAAEFELFIRLLLEEPPPDEKTLGQVLSPLFLRTDYHPRCIFPALLDGLAQPLLAAAVLDLANYLTRQLRVDDHPARDREAAMIELLGEIARRLGQLEEHPERQGVSPRQLAQVIAHAVSLAVSLCDALALMQSAAAIPQLQQLLALRHRRLRTEAACALAKLGDESGRDALPALAAEPVARLRVLAYAEELGLLASVDTRWQSPEARAESALVLYLAEPMQYGVPPATCTLLDHRMSYWPGYEEPVDCFLFRFEYRFQTAEGVAVYTNAGIVGPLVRAISVDLTSFPIDDIYAIFAGWHVEHEEIFEVEAHLLSDGQRIEAARLERRLRDLGCDDLRPVMLAYFLSEKALVAKVKQRGQEAIALAGPEEFLCYPVAERSPGPDDVLHLYRGRKILAEFNPDA